MESSNLPKSIESEEALEELLARPSARLVEMLRRLDGDIMILGAGGKMGPSLARLARNAVVASGRGRRVLAVSRFSDAAARSALERDGVETISCDLLDADEVAKLPRVSNVIFMAGRKFGASGSEGLTWMTNVVAPYLVARHYRGSRIVAFSTGCVYALVDAASGGSKEGDAPGPVGEYATSCLGRERIFEHHAAGGGVLQYRLNYAVDLRYGILVDIARTVAAGKPVDLSVNSFNCIWQGDANERALLSLEHTSVPAAVLNITGEEVLKVEAVARRFGDLLGREVTFAGRDRDRSYLADASRSIALFGRPLVDSKRLMEWVASWIGRGGVLLEKPTMFQVTDGDYLSCQAKH